MGLSNHENTREDGNGEREGDGREVQIVVRFANCTCKIMGKLLGEAGIIGEGNIPAFSHV